MEVRLTPAELTSAAMVGVWRRVASLRDNRRDLSTAPDKWAIDIEGAAGECAFAKAVKMYWPMSIGTFKTPDVGDFEVRTRSSHESELIVYQNDRDDAKIVLVTGKDGVYRVRGYILGKDAKNVTYRRTETRNDTPFIRYLVPISKLIQL